MYICVCIFIPHKLETSGAFSIAINTHATYYLDGCAVGIKYSLIPGSDGSIRVQNV